MVFWRRAYLNSLICIAWSFFWLFLGSILIYFGFNFAFIEGSDVAYGIFLIILGFVVFGLPFNTAFFKFFPDLINKAETPWSEAFRGSASYFGQALGWGLFFFLIPLGLAPATMGIRASYYQILSEKITGEVVDGKSAWRAAGHMFGWVILWLIIGGIIIGSGVYWVNHNYMDYNTGLISLIFITLIGIFLMIMGITAAEFKEFGDVVDFEMVSFEDAFKSALSYACWSIIWLCIAGAFYYFISNYLYINRPIFPPPNYYLNTQIYMVAITAISLFILSWGCLAAYMKYFGDLLERF